MKLDCIVIDAHTFLFYILAIDVNFVNDEQLVVF